jgi:hypothetical protein
MALGNHRQEATTAGAKSSFVHTHVFGEVLDAARRATGQGRSYPSW